MGVSCVIRLPDNVRVSNVANVIGAAAGCEAKRRDFTNHDGWAAHVKDVEVKETSVVGMVKIVINKPTIDSKQNHFVYYHFESEAGGRLLNPPSTAFWIAIGIRLVDFFGGEIDYNDCDDKKVDYAVPARPRIINHPCDGKEWYYLQERILAIKPITLEEWNHLKNVSSY